MLSHSLLVSLPVFSLVSVFVVHLVSFASLFLWLLIDYAHLFLVEFLNIL